MYTRKTLFIKRFVVKSIINMMQTSLRMLQCGICKFAMKENIHVFINSVMINAIPIYTETETTLVFYFFFVKYFCIESRSRSQEKFSTSHMHIHLC